MSKKSKTRNTFNGSHGQAGAQPSPGKQGSIPCNCPSQQQHKAERTLSVRAACPLLLGWAKALRLSMCCSLPLCRAGWLRTQQHPCLLSSLSVSSSNHLHLEHESNFPLNLSSIFLRAVLRCFPVQTLSTPESSWARGFSDRHWVTRRCLSGNCIRLAAKSHLLLLVVLPLL